MNQRYKALAASVVGALRRCPEQVGSTCGELTYEVDKADLLDTCVALRDEPDFGFRNADRSVWRRLSSYGESEWQTRSASDSGFSRGVNREVVIPDPHTEYEPWRFAVVYHLLSISTITVCVCVSTPA